MSLDDDRQASVNLEKSTATTPELLQNALNEAVSALEMLANTDNADPQMPA